MSCEIITFESLTAIMLLLFTPAVILKIENRCADNTNHIKPEAASLTVGLMQCVVWSSGFKFNKVIFILNTFVLLCFLDMLVYCMFFWT